MARTESARGSSDDREAPARAPGGTSTPEQCAWAAKFCGIPLVAFSPDRAAPGGAAATGRSEADGDGTISSRPWPEAIDEALHGPPEYVPPLNIDPAVLSSEDVAFEGATGERFKKLVQDAAAKVGLDPGLLAASLLAEQGREMFTQTGGELDTMVVGADDFLEKQAEIEKRIPAAKEIVVDKKTTSHNEQGRKIETAVFNAKSAVLVDAVYVKYAELKVRDAFEAHHVDFESLTPELRFAFTRLAVNPGKTPLADQVEKFLHTRDIADTAPDVLIRTGVKQQDARKPQSGATRVAGIGLHLSQKIFGTKYVASSQALVPPAPKPQ